MQYRIEPARPEDIDEILRIENLSFLPDIRESRETFLDRLATCPQCFKVLLPEAMPTTGMPSGDRVRMKISITSNRPIIGYFCAEIWKTVPLSTSDAWALGHTASSRHRADGTILYISSFAIDPRFRGGSGRFLFNESLRSIRKECPLLARIIFLVHENWQTARHIYETEGFRYTGKMNSFFGPATAALVMEKEL